MANHDITGRRGFLRGLAALPLIGGGVTLIGNPTAAAVPVSRVLLHAYGQWLHMERRILLHEMYPDPEQRRWANMLSPVGCNRGVDLYHLPSSPMDWRTIPQPSSRAAAVLATVGCEWMGQGVRATPWENDAPDDVVPVGFIGREA
jgi:hypothetical protein